jgi:sugar transferase (PEP-CTERM/EpsH1 system associated)
MTGEILFLAHRMPFPPNRGDKIRSHHVLKRLAELAPVHVATFADDDADMAEEAALAALAQSHCLVRRSKPLILAGMQSLLQGRPVSLPAFYSAKLADYVVRTIAQRPISAIYVFSGQMGQYVPASFTGKVAADFVDVDSAKFDAYGEAHPGLRGLIEAREGRLLRAEEARLAARADVSLLISKPEADLFASRLPYGCKPDVQVLRNGIDSASFDPAGIVPEPKMLAISGPRLIFTGQMDYAPNIAAAHRVAERILPAIRAELPNTSFHVVGRNPPQELRDLERLPGCHVWGAVPDIRTWLAAADLALVPLEIARGVQNKVLEAMAMALPVVLTPGAATGIDAVAGTHYAVVGDDAALAGLAFGLLCDPVRRQQMGQDARRFVVEQLSWEATLAPLVALLGEPSGTRVRDAA